VLREDAQQAGGAGTAQEDPIWRCAACGEDVARDRDRISLDGAQTRAFVNPDGFEYVIAGFAHAPGCLDASEPSSYWSWFRAARGASASARLAARTWVGASAAVPRSTG